MEYKICTRCIMDISDPNIYFDENGICNNCKDYQEKIKKRVLTGKEAEIKIQEIVNEIKEKGRNNKYDCAIGISGGTDSSYVLYLAKKLGLRPLAVHLDNGWNSKTATMNINRVIKKLDIDLYTYVLDWEEFKDLQLAYLKASVIDIEAITDHAIKATVYKAADENGIKYILSGINFVTEGIIPKAWGHYKNDYINILDIHKNFSTKELKTFPILTLAKRFYYQILRKMKVIEILNYTNYNKKEAQKLLKEEFGWEDYGGKHRESTFTHFYQSYILPRKFKIDKRRAHLSSLILAGEISRDEALKEIEKPIYTEEELSKEKEYVTRKLGISDKEFEELMNLPIKSHHDYKSNERFLRNMRKLYYNIKG